MSDDDFRDPWTPPERRVPLGKQADRPADGPGHPAPAGPPSSPWDAPDAAGAPPGPAAPGGTPPGDGAPPPPIGPEGPSPAYGDPYAPPAAAGHPGHPGWPGQQGHPGGPGYGGYGYGYGWPGPGVPQRENGFGVTALVLGIVSVVVFCVWGLGVVLGVLALVFGVLGRR